MPRSSQKNPDRRPYAELAAELEAIVAWFESDQFDIEQAAAQYARAQDIVAAIEAKLTKTENQIKLLGDK